MDERNEQFSEGREKKKPRWIRIGTIFLGLFFAGTLAVVGLFVLIAFRPDSGASVVARRILPFPVALVDGAFISYGELDKDRESIRRFYESQADDLAKNGFRVDFSTPQGQDRLLIREKDILNKLVEDRIIVALAREKNIQFSESDVAGKVAEAIRSQGGNQQSLEDQLQHLYGWNFSEFKEKIVVPSLYRDALEASFVKGRDTTTARATLEKASSELAGGTPFEDVAGKFSDGDSKKNGGRLGWTDIETLVPELQDAARTQAIGAVGPVIESSLGFHILRVSDRKTELGKSMANLEQIFARKPSFPEWLAEKKREATIILLPRRYVWDAGSGSILFRDERLRAFEKSMLQRSEGDPSLIF